MVGFFQVRMGKNLILVNTGHPGDPCHWLSMPAVLMQSERLKCPTKRKEQDRGGKEHPDVIMDFPDLADGLSFHRWVLVCWRRIMGLDSLATVARPWTAGEAGEQQMLEAFSSDMLQLWRDPAEPRKFVWPINMRLGVIE